MTQHQDLGGTRSSATLPSSPRETSPRVVEGAGSAYYRGQGRRARPSTATSGVRWTPEWRMNFQEASTFKEGDKPPARSGAWWSDRPKITGTSSRSLPQSPISMTATRTTYLKDYDASGEIPVTDVPLGMEPPAKRPVSKQQWASMSRDSLRPDPPETYFGSHVQMRGWVRKAVGRPPLTNWQQRVWLFLQDDRLCWIKEQDFETHRQSLLSGTAPGAAATGAVTNYPSAAAALRGAAERPASSPGGASSVSAANTGVHAKAIQYIPLDRIPVRSTPRGYVPGTAITKVSDSQVVASDRIGAAFAITAGAHTHFFSAEDAAVADDWVRAVRTAWYHAAMHTQRSNRAGAADIDAVVLREQALYAQSARLAHEKKLLHEGLERAEAGHTMELQKLQAENIRLKRSLRATVPYEIRVVTSSQRGAETNSRVYMEFFGAEPGMTSGEHRLQRQPGEPFMFRRGASDVFTVTSEELQRVVAVNVWQDASGTRPDWLLESVHVRSANDGKARWVDFPARLWLSTTKGKRRLAVRLESNKHASDQCMYQILVKTSNMSGAGTEANVSIRLVSESEQEQDFELSSGADDFARNVETEFVVTGVDHGALKGAWLGHDNFGYGSDWHVASVSIQRKTISGQTLGKRQQFVAGRWIRGAPGTPQNPILLTPISALIEEADWEMEVHTGRLKGAGTDATIYFAAEFVNPGKGQERVIWPEIKLPTNPELYERGSIDVFPVRLPKPAPIALHVRHDNRGDDPDWYLQHIVLRPKGQPGAKPVYFPCFNWLRTQGSAETKARARDRIDRTLMAADKDPLTELVTYAITVFTSDTPGSGTDANVSISLEGEAGYMEQVPLRAPQDAFSPGRTDSFTIEHRSLGELKRCRLTHDNSGEFPDWRVYKVEVTEAAMGAAAPAGPGSGPIKVPELVTFWFCRFLCEPVRTKPASAEALAARGGLGLPKLYRIMVWTTNVKGGSTDDGVYITLNGERETVQNLALASRSDTFEAGRCDTFEEVLPHIGPLRSIMLWHDQLSKKPNWHLNKVKIVVEEYSEDKGASSKKAAVLETYSFYFRDWVKPDAKGDNASTGELVPGDTDPDDRLIPATVEVLTSGERNAGTDSDVRVMLHGTHDSGQNQLSTSWLTLDASHDTFERGATDTFEVEMEDVGKMTSLDVAIDCRNNEVDASKLSWTLEYIKVTLHQEPPQVAYFNGPKRLTREQAQATLPAAARKLLTTYKVTFWTSRIAGAGTDALLSVKLRGSDRETGMLQLPCYQEDFEEGRMDCKQLQTTDVGDVKALKVLLAGDASNRRDQWHLLKALIVHEATHKQYWFAAHRWITPGQETELQLVEGDPEQSMPTARITVETANTWNADTSARVWLRFCGGRGETGKMPLINSKGAQLFQRGARDEFQVQIQDVGPLKHIDIGHDGSGASPGWLLNSVTIMCDKGMATPQPLYFINRQTIPQSGTGAGHVRLFPHDGNPQDSVVTWTIRTQTGSEWDAQLDAAVDIVLLDGESSELTARPSQVSLEWGTPTVPSSVPPGAGTGQRGGAPSQGPGTLYLEKPQSGSQPFRRGAQDTFTVQGPALDSVTKVVIGHASTTDAWYLDWVEISDSRGKVRRKFWAKQWIGQAKGRPQRVLLTSQDDPELDYTVVVKTSDLQFAGTDNDIFLEVLGKQAHQRSGEMALRKSRTHTNPFERKQQDEFMVRGLGVGVVDSITLRKQGFGPLSDWHVDWVSVTPAAAPGHPSRTYYFNFNTWIKDDKHHSSKALDHHPDELKTMYIVRVQTANERGAGTDANVFITLHGAEYETARWPLDRSKLLKPSMMANLFERNQTDEFQLRALGVGEVKAVTIEHDGTGPGAGWKLAWVEVKDVKENKTYKFVCNRWLDATKEDGSILRKLYPGGDDANKIEYKVSVQTGNERGAGTDADVYVILSGAQGVTPKIDLSRVVSSHKDLFERGQLDEFLEAAPAVGSLQSLTIGHNNKGFNADWMLDHVLVTNTATGESVKFATKPGDEQWFSRTRGDRAIERVLYPAGVDVDDVLCPWSVSIKTANNRGLYLDGTGTDADVFITIAGNKASERKKLDAAKEAFEAGRLDTSRIHTADLGDDVKQVKLDINGGDKWLPEEVFLANERSGKRYYFCNKSKAWVSKASPLTLTPTDPPATAAASDGLADYSITVNTSASARAGTAGAVKLSIHGRAQGEAVSTGPQPLPGPFKAGSSVRCALKALQDVDEITHVTVAWTPQRSSCVDCRGDDDWLLDTITIRKEPPGTSVETFFCKDWLRKGQQDGKAFVRELHNGNSKRNAKTELAPVEAPGGIAAVHDALPGASSVKASIGTQHGPTTRNAATNLPSDPSKGYLFMFKVARGCCTGTQGSVRVNLYGDLAETGPFNFDRTRGELSAGTITKYTCSRLLFVGDVKKMRIRMEPPYGLLLPGLKLDDIQVKCLRKGTVYSFGACHLNRGNRFEHELHHPRITDPL